MSTNSSPPPTPTTPSYSSYTLQQRIRSTLPAECLVMIFNYLDQDRSTLHALLRVNRQFFQLTIPILYRSPFRLLESRAEAWSWSERTQRQVHLLQLFMHVVQIKQIDRHEATTAAAIKSRTRTGTQRKWRHPQSPGPLSDHITANPINITATLSALSSPTGSSDGSNGIVIDRGQPDDDAQQQQLLQEQQQQPLQTVRRQRKILRFKSGTQPWWARRRPSFSPSSSSTTTASSSLSSSSSSFSFSSNWAFSSPSSSYSSSSTAFSAFFGSKKESNVPVVPGNIQEAAACLQQDEQSPLSTTTATTTTDNQQHLLHDHPTLTTTPAVALTDNNNNKDNNPVPHTTYLNYPIARSRDIITNNSNDNNNNDDVVIDCGQHRSHRWSEPPQQTDLCLRYYFDPDDSHSPSPSPSHQHNNNNNNNNNKHIRFGDSSGHSSGNPFVDTDHYNHHHQLYSHTYMDSDEDSLEGNDSYDDDDDDLEYGTNRTIVETTTTFSPWCSSSLEPDLGPFNAQPDKMTSNNWTRALQQKLRCMTGLDAKETKSQEQHHSDSSASEGLMADYLQHYVDQSHPGLLRILPFVFPTLPAEAFDQLSYSRAMIPTATPLPGHGGSVSPSTSHSVLNIFNTLQPSHGSNLERAQSIRVGVERDLLHHSPHRINTIAVSVSRLPAIMSLPQRQSPPSPPSSRRGSTTTATGGLHSTAVSSLTSLFSFLSSSPFSASPLSNMPTATSSSSSLSSIQSTQSSCSTTSSSSSVSSIHTDSWASTNRFSRLRHLTRIEFHDIHHKFDEEAVVDFLTSHSRTYDTIREVKIGGPNDIGKSTAPRVVRILSCLRKVKVLDMTEWREAIKYLDMIPTQHLETLLLGNVRMTNNPTEISEMEQQQQQQQQQQSEAVDDEQQHKEDPQILALQQCRRLRELRMPVLVDGLFEWAVQERQIRLSSFSRPSLSWSSSSGLPYWVDGPTPVQLENVHLSGSSTGPLISTLLHVVDAFRDSLQVLQCTSWIDSTETGSCSQSLAWTWCLPNLQVLDLQGEIAYRFKIQSLDSCPQLRVLRLTLPHCFLPSSSYSSSPSTAGSGPVGLTALTTEPEASAGQLSSSGGPSSPPSSRLCACHRRNLRQRQQRQQRNISLADVLGDNDSDDSDCTCHTPNSSNSTNSNSSPSYIGQDRHRHHHDLFPRLEELKLVGDWGLTNESLLGIAKKMPRLERLSLLRCESDKLTALGLIRAMPSLRGDVVNGDNGGGAGGCGSCRVRWMEICKSWQCEIGAAIEYDEGCCEGESDSDRRRRSEMYMAFVAAVKGGVCPLHIEYQY